MSLQLGILRSEVGRLALSLPDVDRRQFDMKCLSKATDCRVTILSYKCAQFVVPVLGGGPANYWHVWGWPLALDSGCLRADDLPRRFLGDADPSSLVQGLALILSDGPRLPRDLDGIFWTGITSEWLECAESHLPDLHQLESLSIEMPAEEVEAWSALKKVAGSHLKRWLGQELISWLDRGRKFELEAFDVRHFVSGYTEALREIVLDF